MIDLILHILFVFKFLTSLDDVTLLVTTWTLKVLQHGRGRTDSRPPVLAVDADDLRQLVWSLLLYVQYLRHDSSIHYIQHRAPQHKGR